MFSYFLASISKIFPPYEWEIKAPFLGYLGIVVFFPLIIFEFLPLSHPVVSINGKINLFVFSYCCYFCTLGIGLFVFLYKKMKNNPDRMIFIKAFLVAILSYYLPYIITQWFVSSSIERVNAIIISEQTKTHGFRKILSSPVEASLLPSGQKVDLKLNSLFLYQAAKQNQKIILEKTKGRFGYDFVIGAIVYNQHVKL